jgi:tetratricopeptide (TPR) repeat protein
MASVWFNLGTIYEKAGDMTSASDCLKKAFSLDEYDNMRLVSDLVSREGQES